MKGNIKRQQKTMLLLLAAMFLMIGACIWLVKYKEEKEENDTQVITEEQTSIATIEPESLLSLYIKNQTGEMTLIRNEEDLWQYDEDALLPVNQTYAQNMINALTDITTSRIITEGVDDLGQFGLLIPSIEISVATKEGIATNLLLGDAVPVAGGYYAALEGGSEVYIVTDTFYNYFIYSLIEMTEVEEIPTITSENITHLTIYNQEETAFELTLEEENPADLSGFTNWNIKQPYQSVIPADEEAVSTLLSNYTGLSFISCVDYNGKNLNLYGLDIPSYTVSLSYFEEFTQDKSDSEEENLNSPEEGEETNEAEPIKTRVYYNYDLMIGDMDEEGNYYAKSKESNGVYTISAATVEKLTNIDAYSIAYHYISLFNIEEVEEIEINTGGKTYTLSIKKEEKTIDGTQTEVAKYYFNGEEAIETNFKNLYQLLIAPVTEREIPKEYTDNSTYNNTDEDSYMTITYHLLTTDEPVIIRYKPFDESYYVVNTNGEEYFLTDKRKIDEIYNEVAGF